jgi:serine protease Do
MKAAAWAILSLLLIPAMGIAQESATRTSGVFRRYAGQVIKIEVVETGSAAKAVVGSGFLVSDSGHIVTNYHVVSKLVIDPARYRAELVDSQGGRRAVRILAVDVVNDLAVVRANISPERFFALVPTPVSQGERLYSLGHPLDLGLSIVEGTYNGLLEHTLYPKIHFTGAINPGMSGGPTITESGQVVGVNVSTAGNEVSFLVPMTRAASLLARVRQPGYTPPEKFLPEAGHQIREYQDAYLKDLLQDSTPTVTLGHYTLPTKPAPFFKCWGDASREPEHPFERLDHQCSTDDYIFLSEDESSGIVELHHRLFSSTELNAFRFSALLSSQFGSSGGFLTGGEGDVTSFRCETRTVRNRTLTFRAAFCLRAYKRLEGLYDAVLTAAVPGPDRSGLVTTLTLSGVSFSNAQRLAKRYLESIRWNP